jgi:hypothetical protein
LQTNSMKSATVEPSARGGRFRMSGIGHQISIRCRVERQTPHRSTTGERLDSHSRLAASLQRRFGSARRDRRELGRIVGGDRAPGLRVDLAVRGTESEPTCPDGFRTAVGMDVHVARLPAWCSRRAELRCQDCSIQSITHYWQSIMGACWPQWPEKHSPAEWSL